MLTLVACSPNKTDEAIGYHNLLVNQISGIAPQLKEFEMAVYDLNYTKAQQIQQQLSETIQNAIDTVDYTPNISNPELQLRALHCLEHYQKVNNEHYKKALALIEGDSILPENKVIIKELFYESYGYGRALLDSFELECHRYANHYGFTLATSSK